MQQVIEQTQLAKDKKERGNMLKCFMYQPVCSGILGFILFFSVIFIVKLLSYFIGSLSSFSFDIYDLILAGLGFILSFLIKFLNNYKQSSN